MTADTMVELHHLLEGPEDAPVLVLANSLVTSLSVWDDQAPALRERLTLCCTSARFVPPEAWEERAKAVRANGVGAISRMRNS